MRNENVTFHPCRHVTPCSEGMVQWWYTTVPRWPSDWNSCKGCCDGILMGVKRQKWWFDGICLGQHIHICMCMYIYICYYIHMWKTNGFRSKWSTFMLSFPYLCWFRGGFSSQKNRGMNRHFDQGLGMHPRNYGLLLNLANLCGTSRTLHTFALCSEKLRGSKITGPHTVQAIFVGTQKEALKSEALHTSFLHLLEDKNGAWIFNW